MKRAIAPLLIVLVLSGSGCYRYHGELPGVLRRIDAREYEVIGTFSLRVERKWWAFGLLKINHGDLRAEVTRAVREQGGDGATNIHIVTEFDFKDVMWSALLTLALFGQSRHMEIQGDVIKFKSEEGQ